MNSTLNWKLKEIEAAAKKATPGSWEYCGGEICSDFHDKKGRLTTIATENEYLKASDAKYIALCNPATILKLTSALRTAVEELTWIKLFATQNLRYTGNETDGFYGIEARARLTLASIEALYTEKGK